MIATENTEGTENRSASCSRLEVAPEARFVATFAFVHPADRIGLLGKLTETGCDSRCLILDARCWMLDTPPKGSALGSEMVDAGSVLWARISVEERWDWDKIGVENDGGWGRMRKERAKSKT